MKRRGFVRAAVGGAAAVALGGGTSAARDADVAFPWSLRTILRDAEPNPFVEFGEPPAILAGTSAVTDYLTSDRFVLATGPLAPAHAAVTYSGHLVGVPGASGRAVTVPVYSGVAPLVAERDAVLVLPHSELVHIATPLDLVDGEASTLSAHKAIELMGWQHTSERLFDINSLEEWWALVAYSGRTERDKYVAAAAEDEEFLPAAWRQIARTAWGVWATAELARVARPAPAAYRPEVAGW